MSKPILVGFDPATADSAPVAFGVAAARFTGAPLIIGSARADRAPEELERILQELDAADVASEFRALPGHSAARALHGTAEEIDAGLLVVGSGSHGEHRASIADRLLHGAPCPVAVVPVGWLRTARLETIGVAFTDTPEAREALRGAAALARRSGAKLRVLSAAEPEGFNQTYGGGLPRDRTTFGEIGGQLRTDAEKVVAAAVADLGDIAVEPDVSVQEPEDFLVAASKRLDLLVCGSRGYGPRRAVLLGGVTHHVTAAAHCPVIVLVRGVEAALEALIAEPATTTH